MVSPTHANLSVRRQCELLSLNRSGLYYRKEGENDFNLKLMNIIDEHYTHHPFIGIIKTTKYLKDLGYQVNEKRVRRLTRLTGLLAIYPHKKNKYKSEDKDKIYPYLLKNLVISRPNQVWSTDITYIRLAHGFIYLVAVIDWYSRFVLSWRVSITLDTSFCLEALEEAIALYGKAEIFNTDQGPQFTSKDFTDMVLSAGMQISMDGRGRAFDNIFTERLWRSIKYEEVFINAYAGVVEARDRLR